jgi:hypothetical protein
LSGVAAAPVVRHGGDGYNPQAMRSASTIGRAIPLLVFTLLFAALSVSSYLRKSATWDEPQQIVSGYAALERGDYRLDPEHPPFVRLWAALPLLAWGARLDVESEAWRAGDAYLLGHEFLYRDNDADALLARARFMVVLLGIGLGCLLFAWARELFGYWPAVGVLALYAVEPNVLAHARLVTTDLGVSCFLFGAVYFLWRVTRRFNLPDLLGAAAFTGLALVSKYSALILVAVVPALLAPRVCRHGWPGTRFADTTAGRLFRAATIVVVLALSAYFATWAAFGFRYAPTPAPPERQRLTTSSDPYVTEQAPRLASAVEWIDRHRLLPNAGSQGFLFGRIRTQQRAAYLGGVSREGGWWFYFPVAFLIKTPVMIMALALAGLVRLSRRWKERWHALLFLVLPPAAFAAAAMTASINIGLRHLLPVYPFVLLAAGAAFSPPLVRGRRWIAGVVLGLALVESLSVYPDYLTFFNRFVGGPRHGHEYLVDSNLDWGQDLSGLKRWMDRRGVDHVNLSYFGTADPAYYGIACTQLPGAPFFAADLVAAPRLPGYVAVSATNLHGVYLEPSRRAFYRPLLEREPVAVIGGSIHVYRVERPWW